MAKARLVKVSSEDAVADLRRQVQGLMATQARKHAAVMDAVDRFADFTKEDIEELANQPPDERKMSLSKMGLSMRSFEIARKARLPKSKVPFGIIAAHESNLARIRRTEEDSKTTRIGVAIVHLPARAERVGNEHAVVIEATEVKG